MPKSTRKKQDRRGGAAKRNETNRRKRGGQRGNKNALKHGLYSRHFSDIENADLSKIKSDDLESEIAMARIAALQVFRVFADEKNGARKAELFSLLTTANVKVATLLRTQKFLRGESDGLEDVLSSLLREMADGGQ